MSSVPSNPSDHNRSVGVICAAYSGTGTLSVAAALERLLDGPVMHGGSQLLGREDAYVKIWSDIFAARRDRPRLLKLLRQATRGFVAVADAPAICFIPELLELYPEAEVLCIESDPVKWWETVKPIKDILRGRYMRLLLAPVPGKRWYPRLAEQFLEQQDELFGPMTKNRLTEHNVWVKKVTPPHKFHMINLKDGWGPLCSLLDTPVPNEDLPRVSDLETIKAVKEQIVQEAKARWLAVMGLACVLFCAIDLVASLIPIKGLLSSILPGFGLGLQHSPNGTTASHGKMSYGWFS
jgi:hypothetical protein